MRAAAPIAALAGAAAIALAVDARAVGCGCLGSVVYHERGSAAVWGGVLLLLPLVGLALWLRAQAFAVAAAVAVGGALSNAVAAERWAGVPDYLVLRWPGILASAGDVAIWAGLAGSIGAVVAATVGHVLRGGSLRDDLRALRRPTA
jgi:hypothetical protein